MNDGYDPLPLPPPTPFYSPNVDTLDVVDVVVVIGLRRRPAPSASAGTVESLDSTIAKREREKKNDKKENHRVHQRENNDVQVKGEIKDVEERT